MADVPFYVIHGQDDTLVPIEYSRDLVSALTAAGGAPRFTEWPGGSDHSSIWSEVYRDRANELYPWMFSQSRSQIRSVNYSFQNYVDDLSSDFSALAVEELSTFGTASPIALNNAGTIAFNAIDNDGTRGIYWSKGSEVETVAVSASGLNQFLFGSPAINDNGNIVFYASDAPFEGELHGIYVLQGNELTQVADEGQHRRLHTVACCVDEFYTRPEVSNDNLITFWTERRPFGEMDSGFEIVSYRNGVSSVVEAGLPTNGSVLVDRNDDLYWSEGSTIRRASGESVETIVEIADIHDARGFSEMQVNDHGAAVFEVYGEILTGEVTAQSLGIYQWEDGIVERLIRPDGELSNFRIGAINNSKAIVFLAENEGRDGIYVFNRERVDKVIEVGSEINGRTVHFLSVPTMNDIGQIAFSYTADQFQAITVVTPTPEIPGDFNLSGSIDGSDIDLLSLHIRSHGNVLTLDVNQDQIVDSEDHRHWVERIAGTYFGDSNLDGEFNSADFVAVFQTGEYEDAFAGNSTWETGDWNGDAEFDSADFIFAFQEGGYEQGAKPRTTAVVPEPNSVLSWSLTVLVMVSFWRRTSI